MPSPWREEVRLIFHNSPLKTVGKCNDCRAWRLFVFPIRRANSPYTLTKIATFNNTEPMVFPWHTAFLHGPCCREARHGQVASQYCRVTLQRSRLLNRRLDDVDRLKGNSEKSLFFVMAHYPRFHKPTTNYFSKPPSFEKMNMY